MKILLDLQGCQTTGSRNRGIGRYSMALARALVREGAAHDFHVLLSAAFAGTIEPIRDALADVLPADRIHVFHAPRDCADSGMQPRWRARAAAAIRRCAIQQLQPDIVHLSSLFEGRSDDCTTEIDPLLDGAPTAVTLYDLIPYLYADRYLKDAATRAWYMRRLESLRRAALLLGISASACSEAESVLAERHGRVVNISSAANPHLFFPGAAGDAAARLGITKPFMMYTGGVDWRKNVEVLIEAFAALPRPLREGLQLAIVCHAEAPARARLQAHAQRHGLTPGDMVLTGFVPDEDLADLYRACELFVFASLHEGFGLPALEAMMCGAAVIGSNASSIPEVIGHADALFDPRSPAQITALMLRALQDDAFRALLKARAAEQAARFSWERTAREALKAMEDLHATSTRAPSAPAPSRARARLAIASPWPPIESGIADYACELAEALMPHYDVELVHDQPELQLPPALQHLPLHDAASFLRHAGEFDRVLYHFGNSRHHAPLFKLLREKRGTVVLHDFFLSGALNWMESLGSQPGAFQHALLRSHGTQALAFDRSEGREKSMFRYPANRFVLERANGVIVHSRHAMQMADAWYGDAYAAQWARIPFPRALPAHPDREAARRELGLSPEDFLVCSFGHIGPTKLSDRLLRAWHASSLACDPRCRLVLVGRNSTPPYSEQVTLLAQQPVAGKVSITGYASRELYERYLCAADLAVQLRTLSRGETSAAALDCLAHGLPLIVNANGSNAELAPDAVCMVPDVFSDDELTAALERLQGSAAERAGLAAAGRAHVAASHDPSAVAEQYRDAIEAFATHPQHRAYWAAVDAIASLGPAPEGALEDAATALEGTWTRTPR